MYDISAGPRAYFVAASAEAAALTDRAEFLAHNSTILAPEGETVAFGTIGSDSNHRQLICYIPDGYEIVTCTNEDLNGINYFAAGALSPDGETKIEINDADGRPIKYSIYRLRFGTNLLKEQTYKFIIKRKES